MNIHQWKQQIKNFNASFAKHKEVRRQWNKHTRENLFRFKKENSIWNLEWKYYGKDEKAMVLVGASPCLTRDVEKLKKLDKNFCIICANSSLKFLLEHNIKPDYVICLDSDDIDIPQHLDINRDDVTLLASTSMCGKALDNWKGPIYFMPYYSIKKELRPKVRSRLGKAVLGGGNSMTQALFIATIIFGSKTVIFVANEYCFDKRKDYYADKNAAKQEPMKILCSCVDILGREKWTLPALHNYVIWTEKVCTDLSPPGFFIDTSFGMLGKDTQAIHVMELSEAIEKVKNSFKIRDRINNAKSDIERMKIIQEVTPKSEPSQVYSYNLQEQREKLLQFIRG